MQRSGTIAHNKRDAPHQFAFAFNSPRCVAHAMLGFPLPGCPGVATAGGNMKAETIVLRSLYAMTALVVVFGVCAFLIQVH
jgi:hypothetical protein